MHDSLTGLLEAWRAAERELARARPGTPAHATAAENVAECRDAYRRRVAKVQRGETEADPDSRR